VAPALAWQSLRDYLKPIQNLAKTIYNLSNFDQPITQATQAHNSQPPAPVKNG
jgi:hypothetical protein